jgi:lysophospholipase L1-like esterase
LRGEGSLFKTKQNLDKKNLPNELAMDLHGHGLVSHKIYRNKRIYVTVLPQGKKNLSGLIEHLAKSKTTKHIIMGVGCNDISNDTTPATVAERVAHVLDTPL